MCSAVSFKEVYIDVPIMEDMMRIEASVEIAKK